MSQISISRFEDWEMRTERQEDGSGTQDSCANVQNTSLRNELWEALGLEKKSDYENPMQIFIALPVADTHRH